MDEHQIDPRLREDSIVVTNPTDAQQPPLQPPPAPAAAAAAAAAHQHQHHHQHHQHPQQQIYQPSQPPSNNHSYASQPPADVAASIIESPSEGPSPVGPPSAQTYGGPQTPLTPTASHLALNHETPGTDPNGGNPNDPNDPKRPRACEACRGLKVKCEPDPANPEGPCKRCAKAGRNCVVTQPTRKRQKKTDSRVAELEKKIDALTASLQATRGGVPGGPAHQPSPEEQNGFINAQYQTAQRSWGPPPAQNPAHQYATEKHDHIFTPPAAAGQKRKFAESRDHSFDVARDSPGRSSKGHDYFNPDVVDRGVLTMDQADAYFARYNDHMIAHLPAVVFPREMTAADLRKSKPLLFLSVMAAASSEVYSVQRPLVKELTQIFAEKVIINGEKSLEMVQALQVSVIWYYPPEHFEELKFYQMVHVGAVMAIDVGLGRRRNNPKSRFVPYTWQNHPLRKDPLPDPSAIECRRAWLACYFLASNVAMALHRPNLVRWTSFMTECMDILESSPEAAPTDKYLCHLVWTHRLAEEVGIQFSMDDPNAIVNVAEPKVQYALRGFERDLAKYSENIPQSAKQPSLSLSFHVLSLYMHEIALYVEKPNEGMQNFNSDSLQDPVPGLNETLTAAHIGALSSCLTAIDGIFESFLSMDVQSIRCLPVFNFVRVAYAVVVLIKMYFSASTPNSELGKVINKDHMKVEEYIEKLLDKFRDTATHEKSRPAGKFLVVLVMLRSWFQKQGKSDQVKREQLATDAGNSNRPNENAASLPQQQQQQQHQAQQQNQQQHTPQQQHATPQQQPPNQYNPANTPLQLLSEIATGNQNNNSTSNNNNGAANTTTPTNLPPWLTGGTSGPQPFIRGGPAVEHDPNFVLGMQNVMPYLNNTLTSDFDYNSLGDGFEQAMDLTFGGFNTGAAPDDYMRWDTLIGSMTGEGLPGAGGNGGGGGGGPAVPFHFG
ncbi:hypothetical protein PG997_005015 [Apiospora hydei]|uniref:Zn(2)-C6 fungal-type domain-containing protein n=1 Tax=Apiospora hydei TaxID=1337664 RepID=A0ABR1X3R3_9PEZI